MSDIALVTTWNEACGIAEHSAMLVESVESQSEYKHEIVTNLHPDALLKRAEPIPPIVVLNYHAALHSQWTPECIPVLQKRHGCKVVVVAHDTGVPNSPQVKALHDVADAMIIHEPCDDLPRAYYHRMGVPGPGGTFEYGIRESWSPWVADDICFKAYYTQPVLGSIGFPFGWKHYDQLAKITGEQGWALLLLAPGSTDEQIAHWRSLNPALHVRTAFTPRKTAVSYLAGCDATAFTYVCHNTGQSAAILQGIAARKPVIALHTCRQFRALYLDPLGRSTIKWAETFEDVAAMLRHVKIQRIDPATVALAEQESWKKRGQEYISIYKSLL